MNAQSTSTHSWYGLEYTWKRSSRSRSLRLKVESGGRIVVSTPPRTSEHQVARFLADHQSWLDRALAQTQRQLAPVTDQALMLFGKWYPLTVTQSETVPLGVWLKQDQILVHPVTNSNISINQAITRFLKATAQAYLLPRVADIATRMKQKPNSITLRQQKTRWGSCSSRGALNFNWRLVHYQPQVIDYVIIHELAHLRHMNHSAKFWALVAQYDPQYEQHRNWLRRYGATTD